MTADSQTSMTDENISQAKLEKQLEQAGLRVQQELHNDRQSFRLLHGRGKCYGEDFETLCIDYFHPFIFVTVFRDFEPAFEQSISAYLEELLALDGIEGLVVQIRRPLDLPADPENKAQGEQQPFFSFAKYVLHHDRNALVFSSCELEKWMARYRDCRFRLDAQRQSIGYFLDSKPLKDWLHDEWKPADGSEAHVLNAFSFTGALGIAALHGRGKSVLNVDLSKGILKTAQTNFQLNRIPAENYRNLAADVRKLAEKREKMRIDNDYSLLIYDPPSFQKGSFDWKTDYIRGLKNLDSLLEEKATIAACLNAPQVSVSELSDHLKAINVLGFREKQILPSAADFPDISGHSAFKCIIMQRS